jgi:hypothetical protein
MNEQAIAATPAPTPDPVGFAAAAAYSIPQDVAAQVVPPPLPPTDGPVDPVAAGAALRQAMPPGLRFATESVRGMLQGHPAMARVAAELADSPRFFGLG